MKKLFPNKNTDNKKSNISDIVIIGFFVAVIAVCSQIVIPFGQIPFTLQTVGVFLSASLLGARRATCSVFVYILLGAVGLPVFFFFSGGLRFLLGPTRGYIIGFLFTAFVVGFITEKLGKTVGVLALSMTIGILLCYAFGTAWFCVIMKKDVLYGLLCCVVPYIIPDIVKIVATIFITQRLDKFMKL